ncbi:MAG: MFS transporter [Hyphomicrobiales bacterium]|nr:MFS transporter [Hyphomicrobiales bacterium]MCP5372555.1 MFS transporter [Hyphomicrobiales bacterium]
MPDPAAAPRLPATRLSAFYGAYFLPIGITLPFWPVWMAGRGLDAGEIGLVLGLGVGLKVVTNPLAAMVADRLGERRRPMIVLSTAAFAGFSLYLGAHGFWTILAVTLLVQAVSPPVMPLAETLSMLAVRRHGVDYARVRLWGSLTFIAGSVGGGWALAQAGADAIYWMSLSAFGLAAAASWLLPDLRPDPSPGPRPAPLVLLRDGRFLLFLGACACIQGGHGVYYGFSTLDWRAAGLSEATIGWLWAEGVIAEIALFAVGGALVARTGPVALLVAAGLGGAVRWSITAATVSLPVLFVVQALHALTFAAAHLGAIYFIARTAPPALSATVQAVYAAVVAGLVMGLSLRVSGLIYDAHGRLAYLAMAVLCLGGGVLAGVLLWRHGDAKGD